MILLLNQRAALVHTELIDSKTFLRNNGNNFSHSVISACNMPQSDRNNGFFHSLMEAGDGEVHHGKETGRQAHTVEGRYFTEASQKPRQQATALKLTDYEYFVKHPVLKGSVQIRGKQVHKTLPSPDFTAEKHVWPSS